MHKDHEASRRSRRHSRTTFCTFALCGSLALVGAQTPPTASTFEVATIKVNRSGETGSRFVFQPGGRFSVVNQSLLSMVRNAYRLQRFHIVGAAAWMESERFDVTAKAADNATPEDMRLMVQRLLADRFKLVVHREMREIPIYALVLARTDGQLGPQLKRSANECASILRSALPPQAAASPPPAPNARPTCGIRTMGGMLIAGGTSLEQLASAFSGAVDRPVADRTGLAGGFDVDLTFTPDQVLQRTGGDAPGQSDGPSFFTALQEQLGLKLESTRGPVEVLVIDSAQRPTED